MNLMRMLKVVLINIIFVLSFLGLLFLLPPIVYYCYSNFFERNQEYIDKRAKLELYKEFEWAEEHFLELGMLTTRYHDFFTWRRNDFKGITVNIDNGIRRTFNGNKQ